MYMTTKLLFDCDMARGMVFTPKAEMLCKLTIQILLFIALNYRLDIFNFFFLLFGSFLVQQFIYTHCLL